MNDIDWYFANARQQLVTGAELASEHEQRTAEELARATEKRIAAETLLREFDARMGLVDAGR